jgi:hypothetical protein
MNSKPNQRIEKALGFCSIGSALNQLVWRSGIDTAVTGTGSNQAFRNLKSHCNKCPQCLRAYNAIHSGLSSFPPLRIAG